jgi:hypothetical protein
MFCLLVQKEEVRDRQNSYCFAGIFQIPDFQVGYDILKPISGISKLLGLVTLDGIEEIKLSQ